MMAKMVIRIRRSAAELVKRGAMSKDEVSMASIRQWLMAHPDQAPALIATNKSYVFFKVLDQEQPLGSGWCGVDSGTVFGR